MAKEILEATEIGEVVSGLRKHGSKLIRYLARELVDVWKVIVESCSSDDQEKRMMIDQVLEVIRPETTSCWEAK